jgi:hypothetical protein
VLHLDLYEVRADEKITVDIPVHLTGTPEGVRKQWQESWTTCSTS